MRARERSNMIARRNVLIAVCIGLVFTTGAARAAEPKSFVEAICAAYQGKDAKGIPLDTDAAVRRYFAPTLAALIINDRKKAAWRGEVGALDGDPFIDAQDWEIAAVDVTVRDITADKASATVAFKNVDRPATVVLDLVKLKQGW